MNPILYQAWKTLVEMAPPTAVSLVLAAAGYVSFAWWREVAHPLPADSRKWTAFWVGLSFPVWGCLDWIMLNALPLLELSFGYMNGFGFLGLTMMRLGIFSVLASAAKWAPRLGKDWRTEPALKRLTGIFWAANLAVYLLAGYSMYYEPFNLQISLVKVPGPDFFNNRPLRIVQLSDTHIERLTKRERQVLTEIDSLQPDLIVLTGDYINLDYLHDPLAKAETREFMSQLEAPFGVYAISGSVDSPQHMADLFEGLDIIVLMDQVELVRFPEGDLNLVGVSNRSHLRDAQALSQIIPQLQPETFSLLLYHTPALYREASAAGIDLYLAGHTHGGQTGLPIYSILTFEQNERFLEQGAYTFPPTTLYISRGLGMEGLSMPRFRIFAPPELVLVEITGQLP